MVWLSAIGCLAIGIVIGFFVAGRTKAAPSKLTDLEKQLDELQSSHARYREEVSSHFSMTAELVQQMTDSYRDVYQHLATGAQELCSGEVANKLLPTSSDRMPGGLDDDSSVQAPKDYAPRPHPDHKGALAEDFGLEKAPAPDAENEYQ